MSQVMYLVYSEEFFGGDKAKMFTTRILAIDYARKWLEETNNKVAIFVGTYERHPDRGEYTRVHAEEPEAEEVTKKDLA